MFLKVVPSFEVKISDKFKLFVWTNLKYVRPHHPIIKQVKLGFTTTSR